MLQLRGFVTTSAVAVIVFFSNAALSQTFPNKPLRIVTAEAGGGTDFIARLVGQGIAGPLGQQVVIDNRPSGVIPGDTVARSQPDGYTLLVAAAIHWIGPLLQEAPYDPVRDFAPVATLVNSTNMVVVHPSLPVKSIKELIALARVRPGELNYGSAGTGAPSHLAPELFNYMAGIKIVRVPYRGGGPALNALLAGEVQVMFASAAAATPYTKSGRVRALAITTSGPSALAPGVPTVAESGVPGYEFGALLGTFAPVKTPPRIIERLNQEIVQFLKSPGVREKLLNAGVEPIGGSPEDLGNTIKSEMARMGNVIRSAGIKL